MKLDSRINQLSDILTCFDIERAKEFIGQKGFFANSIDYFREGAPFCAYGTLKRIFGHEDQTDPFLNGVDDKLYSFFIPESSLKSAKKKYIPFRYINELQECDIKAGKVITVRHNNYPEVVRSVIVSEVNYDPETLEVINITLGATGYEFATLFNSYLFQVNGEWKPFGVKEE